MVVGDTTSVPLIGSPPVQPPEAVHTEVGSVLDQVSVELPPAMIVVGLADKVTEAVPGGLTARFADAVADPPGPVHVTV